MLLEKLPEKNKSWQFPQETMAFHLNQLKKVNIGKKLSTIKCSTLKGCVMCYIKSSMGWGCLATNI
jgi:hypothetical protein